MDKEEIIKLISDSIYSHERFSVTREECYILSRDIFEKLEEKGLLVIGSVIVLDKQPKV